MSSKKKQSQGTGTSGQSAQDFSLERPLQTVILALSPLVFRPLLSPETTLLDLLVNLAPSVSSTVVVTTREYVDRVHRGRVFVISDSALASEASILRELWGTGIGCPVSGDFLLIRGDQMYGNFLSKFQKFPRHPERVMTRVFDPPAATASLAPAKMRRLPGTGEVVEAVGESEILEVGNLYADVLSMEVFKILADQLDWEISDLPGNLLYSKYHDMISGEFASVCVLPEAMIGNFHISSPESLVSLVLKNVADFFPIRPSRKIGNFSLASTSVQLDAATLDSTVVTGNGELAGNFRNCVISGRAKLSGNFENCVISGEGISLIGNFCNCIIIDDNVEIVSSEQISDLRQILGRKILPEAKSTDSAAPEIVATEISGSFTAEVGEFIFEASENDEESMETAAKQLRIFRTTQNESVERLVAALAAGVGRKGLHAIANRSISRTSEKQKVLLEMFEKWSEALEMMYVENEYLENEGLDLLASEFREDLWLVLWAMYQTEFFVDRKLILEWPLQQGQVGHSEGLRKFLDFLREEISDDDETSD